jgi:photosystem II stability/assembly factor-like uncharacterized protein
MKKLISSTLIAILLIVAALTLPIAAQMNIADTATFPEEGDALQTYPTPEYNFTISYSPILQRGGQITDIHMLSPTDGWAVGWLGAILHWNGNNWQDFPSPNLYDLSSVQMISSSDGWIVGGGHPNETSLRWNGNSWKTVPCPSEMQGGLSSVCIINPENAWAVGYSEIIHWNGQSWNQVTQSSSEHNGLRSVFMLSSTDGWAVGSEGTILHWNGQTWNKTPAPTNSLLTNVYMLTSDDGWAVGAYNPNSKTTTMLRWDGTAWRSISTPGNTTLYDIVMLNKNCGWAVGNDIILHWNGTAWTKITSPVNNGLYTAIYPTTENQGWIAGSHWIGNESYQIQQPLILSYTQNPLSPTPSPTQSPSTPTITVSPKPSTTTIPTTTPQTTPSENTNPPTTTSPSPTPNNTSLKFDLQCNTALSNFTAKINGSLTTHSKPLPSATVNLFYSKDNGSSWNQFSLTNTDNNGKFSQKWQPPVNNSFDSFVIKAKYEENSTHSRAEATLYLATTSNQNQSILSVISNSPITKLEYNTTNKQLSFNVSSPLNTTGYAKAYVDKTLIENASDITVFVDGIQKPYNTELIESTMTISLAYDGGNHSVVIDLGNSPPIKGMFEIPIWLALLVGTVLIIFTIAIVTLALGKIGEPKPTE